MLVEVVNTLLEKLVETAKLVALNRKNVFNRTFRFSLDVKIIQK